MHGPLPILSDPEATTTTNTCEVCYHLSHCIIFGMEVGAHREKEHPHWYVIDDNKRPKWIPFHHGNQVIWLFYATLHPMHFSNKDVFVNDFLYYRLSKF